MSDRHLSPGAFSLGNLNLAVSLTSTAEMMAAVEHQADVRSTSQKEPSLLPDVQTLLSEGF